MFLLCGLNEFDVVTALCTDAPMGRSNRVPRPTGTKFPAHASRRHAHTLRPQIPKCGRAKERSRSEKVSKKSKSAHKAFDSELVITMEREARAEQARLAGGYATNETERLHYGARARAYEVQARQLEEVLTRGAVASPDLCLLVILRVDGSLGLLRLGAAAPAGMVDAVSERDSQQDWANNLRDSQKAHALNCLEHRLVSLRRSTLGAIQRSFRSRPHSSLANSTPVSNPPVVPIVDCARARS